MLYKNITIRNKIVRPDGRTKIRCAARAKMIIARASAVFFLFVFMSLCLCFLFCRTFDEFTMKLHERVNCQVKHKRLCWDVYFIYRERGQTT